MVNNNLKVLDAGKLKCVPEVIHMVKFQNFYFQCKQKNQRVKRVSEWNDEQADFIEKTITNEKQKAPTPRISYAMKKYEEMETEWDYSEYPKGPQNLDKKFCNWAGGEDAVYEYLDIIPFTPSVMINISPNWKKGKIGMSGRIQKLKEIIDNYMAESWYQKWSYVIENGGEGNHIHAHCVCELNRTRLKGCETHLAKGRHTVQLKKYANKVKGMEGIIEGVSIQKTILRNETLVKDKLDYLVEELKPIGHKNKSIIPNGFVSGSILLSS